jgi:hypothetical protein
MRPADEPGRSANHNPRGLKKVVFNLASPLAHSKAVFRPTVKAPGGRAIAAIRFSGPRDGEFLAADEIRFTTD